MLKKASQLQFTQHIVAHSLINQLVFEVVQPSHPKSKLTVVVQLLFNIPSSPKSAVIKQFFGSSLAGQSLSLCKLHKDNSSYLAYPVLYQ